MFEPDGSAKLYTIDNDLLHLRKKKDKLNIKGDLKKEKIPF